MELTEDEIRLIREAFDAWEYEGCFTSDPTDWDRTNKKEGLKRIEVAYKGLIKKGVLDKVDNLNGYSKKAI